MSVELMETVAIFAFSAWLVLLVFGLVSAVSTLRNFWRSKTELLPESQIENKALHEKFESTLNDIKLSGKKALVLTVAGLVVSLILGVTGLRAGVPKTIVNVIKGTTTQSAFNLKTFSDRMHEDMEKSNANTQAMATHTECLNDQLTGLNQEMKQLNQCVMQITRDIKSMRATLENQAKKAPKTAAAVGGAP